MTPALSETVSDTGPRIDILTPDQWRALQAFSGTLTASQAVWTSGYLLALSRVGAPPASAGLALLDAPGDDARKSGRRLTILYGSETGNSAALARTLATRVAALGPAPTLVDMADYAPRRLKDEQDLLVITSTYGDGDPPQPAVAFFEFVDGRKAPSLVSLRYAVLALGDSSYEHFCESGRTLDLRLEALGARRLLPRVDCDVDFETPATTWMDAVLDTLAPSNPVPAMRTASAATTVASAQRAASPVIDRRNPLMATVSENLILTGRGSTKETRHIELSIPEGAIAFSPGDALGVVTRNDPRLVEAILDRLGLEADTAVCLPDRTTTIGVALEREYEITTATPRFLDEWAKVTASSELGRLARTDNATERAAFLRAHHAIDILRLYPATGVTPDVLLRALRPLTPRLYSIASSAASVPDEVHLTVSTVRYVLHDVPRLGVASGHLAERSEPGATIPVYVRANPHFRLPADDVPILMIGAGTGVAPYRSFLQEREARGATGRSWLVFGERNSRTDFLYQLEWQDYLRRKVLHRMDVAFSRDTGTKTYVQHRLIDHARDVFDWFENGAHVYVCGDATHLAPDVHEALTTVVECAGGFDREGAEEYLRALQQAHRYQRDVY